MDIEFHYYITYYLARKAGFSEKDSYLLAYSSQLTDHNNCVYSIRGGDEIFENYISQTLDITKPQHKLMRVYLCFHFVPGDYLEKSAYRRDGKLHLLNTTPCSRNSMALLDKALESNNIYRIGIAVHAFCDTWAHQNFIGDYDSFNKRKMLYAWLIPNIGHADFLKLPDMMGLCWEDERLIPSHSRINNQERALEAAFRIYRKLRLYKNNGITEEVVAQEWTPIAKQLTEAIGPVYSVKELNPLRKHKRMEAYRALLDYSYMEYKPFQWFEEAVNIRVKGLRDKPAKFGSKPLIPDIYTKKPDFEKSHWYQFQMAVKAHQKTAREILKPTLEKMEFRNF